MMILHFLSPTTTSAYDTCQQLILAWMKFYKAGTKKIVNKRLILKLGANGGGGGSCYLHPDM
jgi:hypothetical protein